MLRILGLVFALILILFSFIITSDDLFGHETYTEISDYEKIFELTEIRFSETAFELFPQSVGDLHVTEFYCEWELAVAGSAKTEILLSVNYNDAEFDAEVARLGSLGDGEVVYDTENFNYPAYVSVLGCMNTSYYALVDEDNQAVHYVLVQLINTRDIDFDEKYLPYGYGELGEVEDVSYFIYE